MAVKRDPKSGLWQVRARYKDLSGKYKEKKKTGFKTKREAQDYENNLDAESTESSEITLKAFVENVFLPDKEKRIKHSTWMNYKYLLNSEILPYLGNCKLNEITPKKVLQWQTLRQKEKNQKRAGIRKTSYLKEAYTILKIVLNYAMKVANLQSNAAIKAGFDVRGEDSSEQKYWSEEQFKSFISFVADTQEKVIFNLLMYGGFRIGELLAITPADFNSEAMSISVTKTYARRQKTDYVTSPKTNASSREVLVPDFVAKMLDTYITSNKIENDERIFTISVYGIRKSLNAHAKEANLEQIRIHDLRHSHITMLCAAGFTNPVEIGKRTGQNSARIVFRYAHQLEGAQEKIQKYFSTKDGT